LHREGVPVTADLDPGVAPAALSVGSADAPRFYCEGYARPVERGWGWLAGGWNLFRRTPGLWVAMMLAFIVINLLAQVVPVLGPLLMALLFPVFIGGFMLGCRALDAGGGLEFAHLFAGFRQNVTKLIVVGVVSLAGTLLLMVAVWGGAVLTAMTTGSGAPPAVLFITGLFGLLLVAAVMVPVYMAIWFAPALIVLQDAPAMPALKASFAACQKNLSGLVHYGVVLLILGFLATLPMAVGWLVLGPVVIGSVYSAYRDIFFRT
jgi:uncharacterized membrane protein